jgi:hypothetical protein
MAPVVKPAEGHEVVKVRGAAFIPVADVVAIGPCRGHRASGKPAAFVAALQRQSEAGSDHTPNPTDVDRETVALGDGHHVRVATQPTKHTFATRCHGSHPRES